MSDSYKPTGALAGNTPDSGYHLDSPTNRGGDQDVQPPETRFIAHGEHVGSPSVNRSLFAISRNVDWLRAHMARSLAIVTVANKDHVPELSVSGDSDTIMPSFDNEHSEWDGWVYHGRGDDASLKDLFQVLDESDGTEVLGTSNSIVYVEEIATAGPVNPLSDTYPDRSIMTSAVSSPEVASDPRHLLVVDNEMTQLDWTDTNPDPDEVISPSRRGLHVKISSSLSDSGNDWDNNDGMYVVVASPDKQTFELGEFLYRIRVSGITGGSFLDDTDVHLGSVADGEPAGSEIGPIRAELGVGVGYIEIDPDDYTGAQMPQPGDKIHTSPENIEATVESVQYPHESVILNNKMDNAGSATFYRDGNFTLLEDLSFSLNDELHDGQDYLLVFGRRASFDELPPDMFLGASNIDNYLDPSGDLEKVMHLDGIYDWAARVTSDPGDGRAATIDAGAIQLTGGDSAFNTADGLISMDFNLGETRKGLDLEMISVAQDGERNEGISIRVPSGYDSATGEIPQSALSVHVSVYGDGVLEENSVTVTWDGGNSRHLVDFGTDLTAFRDGTNYNKWPDFSVYVELYDFVGDARTLNGRYRAHAGDLGVDGDVNSMPLILQDDGGYVDPSELGGGDPPANGRARFLGRSVGLHALQLSGDRVHGLVVNTISDQVYGIKMKSKGLTGLFIDRDSGETATSRPIWVKGTNGANILRVVDKEQVGTSDDEDFLEALVIHGHYFQSPTKLMADGAARMEVSDGGMQVWASRPADPSYTSLFSAVHSSAAVNLFAFMNANGGLLDDADYTRIKFGDDFIWYMTGVSGRKATLELREAPAGAGDYLIKVTDPASLGRVWEFPDMLLTIISGVQTFGLNSKSGTPCELEVNGILEDALIDVNSAVNFNAELHLNSLLLRSHQSGSSAEFTLGGSSFKVWDGSRFEISDKLQWPGVTPPSLDGLNWSITDPVITVNDTGGSQTDTDPGGARNVVDVGDVHYRNSKTSWFTAGLTTFTGGLFDWAPAGNGCVLRLAGLVTGRAPIAPMSEGSKTGSVDCAVDAGTRTLHKVRVRYKKLATDANSTFTLRVWVIADDGDAPFGTHLVEKTDCGDGVSVGVIADVDIDAGGQDFWENQQFYIEIEGDGSGFDFNIIKVQAEVESGRINTAA